MKEVCRIYTGSTIYGTSTPSSDLDITGVFVNELSDFFGLQNPKTEHTENVKISNGPRNTSGDVDCKLFSLKKFLKLAGEGQPLQLEMMFAPDNCIISTSEIWQEIIDNRSMFLSAQSVAPFIGFAVSQFHKASIKGTNLKAIEALISMFDLWGGSELSTIHPPKVSIRGAKAAILSQCDGSNARFYTNEHGAELFEVAGRSYDVNQPCSRLLESLKVLQAKYGTRSRAASETGYDYKSLHHAYRLILEARELLNYGKITLPIVPNTFLMAVKEGQVDMDFHEDLKEQIASIHEAQLHTHLPDNVNWSKIESFCEHLHVKALL